MLIPAVRVAACWTVKVAKRILLVRLSMGAATVPAQMKVAPLEIFSVALKTMGIAILSAYAARELATLLAMLYQGNACDGRGTFPAMSDTYVSLSMYMYLGMLTCIYVLHIL